MCLALGTSLVLVVQQAPPAAAFQAPMPPPVTVPGSAYPSTALSGMNANDYNRALSNNPMGYVTAKSDTLLNKAGKAMAVVGGVDLVYGLTVGPVTHLTGMSTSGSLSCDLAAAVVGSNCAVKASPDYVPNSDVVAGEPGWVGGQNFLNSYPHTDGTTTTVGASIIDAPGRHEPGRIAISIGVLGWPSCGPAGPYSVQGLSLQAYGVRPGTLEPTTIIADGTVFGGYHNCGSTPHLADVIKVTTDLLDRIELFNGFTGERRVWYPVGHPLRPDEVETDPQRWWHSRWTCSDGSTGSADSALFRETESSYPQIPAATCEVGHAVLYEVLQFTSGLVDGIRVYFWEKAPGGKTEWEGVPAKCLDFVSCILEVLRVDPETGEEIDCLKHPDVCTDFDPFPPPRPLPDGPDPEPEKYRCKWGGHVVALSDCAVYEPTLAEPESSIDPAPKPRPYGDPTTGDAPDDVPGPTPNPPGSESPGAPQDPNCPPPFKWNSLVNPWWYYQGVKCSLSWAFVPAGGFVIGAGLIAAWDDTALGDLADSVNDLSDVVMDGTCGQLFSVEPSVFKGETFTVDTCHPFWTGAQPLRSLIGISFVVGATYTGLRIALGSFGIYLGIGGGKDS